MKKITRKKHLEMRLQSIPYHPNPKVGLEQYTTPSVIASDLVWNAYSLGDIEDRDVVDLGCGTGVFAIASALMGANSSVGIDIDNDSIELANDVAVKLKAHNVKFIECDIDNFNLAANADTVFQNPPFGSQKLAEHGSDLKFLKKAADLHPDVIYSFHMASSEDFLIRYYNDNNFLITHIFRYSFPIPKIYDFHTKENQNVAVIVIRAELKF